MKKNAEFLPQSGISHVSEISPGQPDELDPLAHVRGDLTTGLADDAPDSIPTHRVADLPPDGHSDLESPFAENAPKDQREPVEPFFFPNRKTAANSRRFLRDVSLRRTGNGQPLAATSPTALENATSGRRGHAASEAVLLGSATLVGLKCTLHGLFLCSPRWRP